MNSPILETKQLKKAFHGPSGDIAVLNNIDFELYRGQSVSIRGESGAGKTTLLYLITGLERPDSGAVFWDGESIFKHSAAWQAQQRGRLMGFIFQAYHLSLELNALENVLLAHRITKGRPTNKDKRYAQELLDSVGLSERSKHLSGQMSGGEQQRVAIARALMNRPALVIADEPTGNLDERTGFEIMQRLLNLCQNAKTSLALVTHNPEFAKQTDRQLYLSSGKIQEL